MRFVVHSSHPSPLLPHPLLLPCPLLFPSSTFSPTLHSSLCPAPSPSPPLPQYPPTVPHHSPQATREREARRRQGRGRKRRGVEEEEEDEEEVKRSNSIQIELKLQQRRSEPVKEECKMKLTILLLPSFCWWMDYTPHIFRDSNLDPRNIPGKHANHYATGKCIYREADKIRNRKCLRV
ncbi:hypothetical protein E2C01_074413 [Portunus trituberculatus]|uniref:Uncharacterized protein n=1 Tax=Portunus trituberculatus TaxID=210409 RepID=A0A5B7I5L8_PORTR|nr:hypothetical protein [Portunus trituberculatus]